ncbi:MAG: hypothetical protein BGO98_35405 [Myxococcales bacterium 68-20]|nr:MAG: hypothetical protein BGO98_35405 [Myxococcales bacterium 68-20]
MFRSVSKFTSHGKRELGQFVYPVGHLFDGQYEVSSALASIVEASAVGVNAVTAPASSRVPRMTSPRIGAAHEITSAVPAAVQRMA